MSVPISKATGRGVFVCRLTSTSTSRCHRHPAMSPKTGARLRSKTAPPLLLAREGSMWNDIVCSAQSDSQSRQEDSSARMAGQEPWLPCLMHMTTKDTFFHAYKCICMNQGAILTDSFSPWHGLAKFSPHAATFTHKYEHTNTSFREMGAILQRPRTGVLLGVEQHKTSGSVYVLKLNRIVAVSSGGREGKSGGLIGDGYFYIPEYCYTKMTMRRGVGTFEDH